MNKTAWKAVVIIGVVIAAIVQLYPNFLWYSLKLEDRQIQAKRKNPLAQKVVPLGLDLQGGVHLVYQLDLSKLPDESNETVTRAVEQNMTVINNRIDALGVANPRVARQGREFILIQLPGVYGSEEAKGIIGKTALLEFRLVREDEARLKIVDEIQKRNLQSEDVAQGRLPEDVKKLIPAGLDLLPSREGGYLLVTSSAALNGRYLKQARVEVGSTARMGGGLGINFELNGDGAELFDALTAAHIGERLAIVLDGVVYSAPTIQTRISGGSGQITGSFSPQEAKNLANVLNSGNLSAPMSVVEERTVGPELGEDSIRSGFRAIAVGFVLVVLFMVVYYKFSGFLADIALVLNMVLLMAVMGTIHASMTMPGIAGILLSLAMAVDANVIILERVREELRKGKDVKVAVNEGYHRAFTAIFDGHITAIASAVILYEFGTGPVKGFGVTLMFGLGISLVTAVWVTHVFYEVWFSFAKPKTLSV